MDSGNTHETQNEVVQPNDAVAADLELIEATPQAETIEPQEFYVDEEADQEQAKQGMSQAQSYAAFQKEKQKRKNKQLEIDEGTRKQAEMQATINELQATVGKITKGEPPTLESCDYDESQFQEKINSQKKSISLRLYSSSRFYFSFLQFNVILILYMHIYKKQRKQ